MAATVQQIRAALEQYTDPYLRQTLQQAGALRDLQLNGRTVVVVVELGIPVSGYEAQFRSALAAHLAAAGVQGLELQLELRGGIVPHGLQRPLKPIPGVGNIIAVASGKGGVGKSTVAVNPALPWAAAGPPVATHRPGQCGPEPPREPG